MYMIDLPPFPSSLSVVGVREERVRVGGWEGEKEKGREEECGRRRTRRNRRKSEREISKQRNKKRMEVCYVTTNVITPFAQFLR